MSGNLGPQIAAISGTVDDLARRVYDLALEEKNARHEERVLALEEIERHLRAASRRMARLVRDVGDS